MINTDPDSNSPAAPDNSLPALSPRQLAARRANALKSTGPRTSEGKTTSRQNSLKHGFFSCDVVSAVLDGPARLDEFTMMLDALLEEYDPQTVRERILIDEVAASCWRVRRILRYECRKSWVGDDIYRRETNEQTPTDSLLTTMGYDRHGDRQRTYRKLRRAGLDAFTLPSEGDVEKIVRYERLVKRNLNRALYTLECIRAARQGPQSSDAARMSEPSNVARDPLDENKI
jgi:hypothetical protein